jgi:hypothetical protein
MTEFSQTGIHFTGEARGALAAARQTREGIAGATGEHWLEKALERIESESDDGDD